MDLHAALAALCSRRKSIRAFSAEPLTGEEIEKIRSVAETSPYASGRKGWHLEVVTERALILGLSEVVRERCEEHAGRMRGDFGEGFLRYAENFRAFESAPALFIPTFKVRRSVSLMAEGDEELARWERESFVKSISCVAMLVLLAAESLGLGACYMTGPLVAQDEIARRIGARRDYEIGAVIPVGHPKG